MASYDISFTATLGGTSGNVTAGHIVCPDADGANYVIATTANLAIAERLGGVAITNGAPLKTVVVQYSGEVAASITGLGAGVAATVIVSATGTMERATGTIAPGAYIIGKCDRLGAVTLSPFAAGLSFGGSGNTIVYRPSDPDGARGNVYLTEATAFAAAAAIEGPVDIFFDPTYAATNISTTGMPVSGWDFGPSVTLKGGTPNSGGSDFLTPSRLADGVKFVYSPVRIDGLGITSDSASAVVTSVPEKFILELRRDSYLDTTSAHIYDLTGSPQISIYLDERCRIGAGTIRNAATSTTTVYMLGASQLDANAFTADSLELYYVSGDVTVASQTASTLTNFAYSLDPRGNNSSGATASRPTVTLPGTRFFDTSLGTNGQPIWMGADASNWVTFPSSGTGTVTDVSGTTPIVVANGTTTPAITHAASGVSANAYAYPTNVTVNATGHVTAITAGSAPVTSINVTDGISSTGGTTPTLSLTDTSVTPGSYIATDLTVNANGQITAAANGSRLRGGSLTVAGTANTLALTATLEAASANVIEFVSGIASAIWRTATTAVNNATGITTTYRSQTASTGSTSNGGKTRLGGDSGNNTYGNVCLDGPPCWGTYEGAFASADLTISAANAAKGTIVLTGTLGADNRALDIYRQPADGPVLMLYVNTTDVSDGFTVQVAFVNSAGTRTTAVPILPVNGTPNLFFIHGNAAGTGIVATKIA